MKAMIEFFEPWYIRLCVPIFVTAVATAGYNWIYWSGLTASDWATWCGSIGTITAVIVAAFAIHAQAKGALALERHRRDQDDAAALLALCYLGREVRQMSALSSFQIEAVGNPILYPDISTEFASMAAMIGSLSVERVAARSAVGHSLALRRIATEFSGLYSSHPKQGDGFYFQNRAKITDLEAQCRKLSTNLIEMFKEFAPELYEQHRVELHKL